MMQKRLILLLLITAVVLGIGLFLNRGQQAQESTVSGALIAELDKQLNDISAIKISGAGGVAIAELNKSEDRWTVAAKDGYAADVSKIREFLIKLSNAQLREEKTSKPENYARLGVEDLSAADAKGLGVELLGLKSPVKLIVGIAGPNGDSTFVRRDGEAKSFLVSGSIIPDKEPGNWLAKSIADIPSERVRRVDITDPDGKVLKIEKTDSAAFNFNVLDVPKGRELSSESAGNQIGGALSSVNLEDVAKSESQQPTDDKYWRTSFATHDGMVIEVDLWDVAEKTWSRWRARVDESQLDTWVAAEKSKAESAATPAAGGETGDQTPADKPAFDAAKARADKLADIQKQVSELNARADGWSFALPSWKAGNFKKTMEEMLQPKS